jgi:hypothetical protein
MAELSRRVRLDFGATIEWVAPDRTNGAAGWTAFKATGAIAEWVKEWFEPDALGALEDIRRTTGAGAALARVRYPDSARVSWLVLLKPCLGPVAASLDLRCFAGNHPRFPNQSTYDQFFDDRQWESYRLLGEISSEALLRRPS